LAILVCPKKPAKKSGGKKQKKHTVAASRFKILPSHEEVALTEERYFNNRSMDLLE